METTTTAAAAADGTRWVGILPTAPLRELAGGQGLRVRLEWSLSSQLERLFWDGDWVRFREGVDQFAAAVVRESQGTMRVAAIAYVGGSDDVALFDVVPASQSLLNITVRELLARIGQHTAAVEVTAVTRVPAMSESERAESLTAERDDANQSSGPDGGSGGSPFPHVGIPEPEPGFFSQFGKYAGLVVGLGALVAVAYVIRTFKD